MFKVNNTIFASLAVKHGFHKHFRHFSPGLQAVIGRFVRFQTQNGHQISEDYAYFLPSAAGDAVIAEATDEAAETSSTSGAVGSVVEEAEDVEVRRLSLEQYHLT